MRQSNFDVELLHLDGSVEIALIGELDLMADEILAEQVRPFVRAIDASKIKVECSRLTFCDARGLGLLIRALRGLRHSGDRVTLCNPPWSLRLVVEIACPDRFAIEQSRCPSET